MTSWLKRLAKGDPEPRSTGTPDGGSNVSMTGDSTGVGEMFSVKPQKRKRKRHNVRQKIYTHNGERPGEPPVAEMHQMR